MTDMDIDRLADAVAERLAIPDDRPLLSPRELGERLNVKERTVRHLLSDGTIPFIKIRGSVKIKPADVDAYVARLEQQE